MRGFVLPLLAAGLVLGPGPASADWRAELEAVMFEAHGCEVNYLTNLRVEETDGGEAVFARVHCLDGRSFDVSRAGPDRPFRTEECAVREC